MASFEHLHQLVEQSLRDIQADSREGHSLKTREFSEALQRLSGRLNDMLAETPRTMVSEESMSQTHPTVSSPSPSEIPEHHHLHVMTSCDGHVLMANDLACDVLGLDLGVLGTVSLSDWIPQKEWEVICPRLQESRVPHEPMRWAVTLQFREGGTRSAQCTVTPMFDHTRRIAGWHWALNYDYARKVPSPFPQLVQSLEAQILAGQSVEVCLTQICEGLVHTFGFPFVWLASAAGAQPLHLLAYGIKPELDWDMHGQPWWQTISRHNTFSKMCAVGNLTQVSDHTDSIESMLWFPRAFNLREALRIPLYAGAEPSGVLVVCSETLGVFDDSVRAWLRALGHQIEALMAKAAEMERLRLQSAAIGSVNYAVCVTNPQGRLEWVNEAYAELVGMPTHQLLGETLPSFPHEYLPDSSSIPTAVSQAVGEIKTEIVHKREGHNDLILEQVLTPLLDEEGGLTHFVAILHDVTARKTTEQRMTYQAYHDALTDLPNRVMFEDRLQQGLAHARRQGSLLAVLFLDLDHFKSVNDQNGHLIGDRLLRVVAKRLQSCVRSTDTVSRLSGDEFSIILQDIEHIPDIRQVVQKILSSLELPIRLGEQEIIIQASIGIAVSPKDSMDGSRLLDIADQAMYVAKESGGGSWHFATSEWNF